MDVSWNYSVITSLDPGSLLIIAGNDQYSGQDRREIPSFVRLIRLKYHAKLKKLNAQTVLLLTAIQLLKFCNWFMKHFQNIFHPPPPKENWAHHSTNLIHVHTVKDLFFGLLLKFSTKDIFDLKISTEPSTS